MFLDDSACNLASLNLMRFYNETTGFDVEAYKHALRIVITAQEITVDNASYPTPAIEKNSHAFRPLGIGYANLGALLMARGLPYDSDEGREYAAAMTSILSGESYAQSARIAAKLGPFEGYRVNEAPFLRVIDKHRKAAQKISTKALPVDLAAAATKCWDDTYALGSEHGFKNAQISVLAPTGTIAFMMDCDTTGIEPDIALVKYKKLVGGGMLKLVNQTVPSALSKLGYTESQVSAITAHIEATGTIEGAPELADRHLSIFDCAFKAQNGTRTISHMGHIKMMGSVQPFISGAISKTVNLPETATVEDVMDAYVEAWKHGVKAIAIYRDGSKKVQPLSTGKETSNSKKDAAAAVTETVIVPRPRRRLADTRASLTHKFTIEGHEGYITVGLFEDNTPGELFVTMAKEGSTLSGMMDAFATSISLSLQYGVPMAHLVEKFAHMRFEPSGWTGNSELGFAKSIVDYVFRWLGYRFLSTDDKMAIGLVRTSEIVDPAPQLELLSKAVSMAAPATTTQETTWSEPARPTARRMNSTPDAPPCPRCGWLTVRNGPCHKCENCGETTGCS